MLGVSRTTASPLIHTDIKNMLAEPLGLDCVISAAGIASVIDDAFMAVKRGRTLMIFGVAPHEARTSLSPFRIYNHEITLLSSMTILFSFQPALDPLRGEVINTRNTNHHIST